LDATVGAWVLAIDGVVAGVGIVGWAAGDEAAVDGTGVTTTGVTVRVMATASWPEGDAVGLTPSDDEFTLTNNKTARMIRPVTTPPETTHGRLEPFFRATFGEALWNTVDAGIGT
jgi:hypothetical protein